MPEWPLYLSRKDLPAFSGLSLNAILKVLDRQGVQPVDIGGKHYRLMYYRDAVIEALGTLHEEAQKTAPEKPARRRPAKLKIVGKTPAMLFEELKGA